MAELANSSMNFDDLLDCGVEDLPEFKGFKQMPIGMHTAYATLTSEINKDGAQFLKLTLIAIETLEGGEPVEPNDEFTFMFYTDKQVAVDRMGSVFKPYMRATEVPNFRELLNKMVGVQVAVKISSYTAKLKEGETVAKSYSNVDEIVPA